MKHCLAPIAFLVIGCASFAAELSSRDEFLAVVSARFATWDADRNGELSAAELDTLVIDPKITGPDAAAVGALRRAARGSRTMPAVTSLTLDHIREVAAAEPQKGQVNLPAMFAFGVKRIASTSRTLFGEAEGGQPRLETIHQGKLGNCFCLAPLGALVHARPQVVASMFKTQPDGSCDVVLGKQTVRVAPPTDSELAFIASNEQHGLWVNLYEKAVAQARNEMKPEAERSAAAIEVLARGGSAGTMLAFITGHEIVRFSCKWAKDAKTPPTEQEARLKELRGLLGAAVSEKRLMTCGTTTTTTPGVTPNHAYAVLGFDAATERLRLWNPHGGSFKPRGEPGLQFGYPMADGVFEIPLLDFVKQFSGLAFEQVPAAS